MLLPALYLKKRKIYFCINDHYCMISAWIGTRHIVTFMLFLGMANAYVMRTNMSVAIVAMVNHTAIGNSSHSSEEETDDECDAVLGNVSVSATIAKEMIKEYWIYLRRAP